MRKFILGVLVGLVISAIFSAMCIPGLIISEGHSKFVDGHKKGIAAGRFEAAETLEKEFGHYDWKGPYTILLSVTGQVSFLSGSVVKTSNVVSIETNGVKTVRVIP